MRIVQPIVFGLFFFYLTLGAACSLYIPKSFAASDGVTVIPEDAIRLRILAHSNGKKDQAVKNNVRDAVNEQITEWVHDLTTIEEARTVIIDHLDEIERIVHDELKAEGISYSYKVEFARVPFPTKLYGNFLYPAGEYEAILITLGEGTGANWWCVLFPPLCFLDFSSGSAVSHGFEEAEETAGEEDEINPDDGITLEGDEEATEEGSEPPEPVYIEEEDVEVKFFVVELWEKFLALF